MEIVQWLYQKAEQSDGEDQIRFCEAALTLIVMQSMIQKAGIKEVPQDIQNVFLMYDHLDHETLQ